MMNLDEIYSIILTKSYVDISDNQATIDELSQFKNIILETMNIVLDDEYLSFLSKINGFEFNGLNFYGTKKQVSKFIFSAFEQNQFWRTEVVELESYFIIGDGDMDFYCYDFRNNQYLVCTKSTIRIVEKFTTFKSIISNMITTYN